MALWLWLQIMQMGCPVLQAHSSIICRPAHKQFAHPYLGVIFVLKNFLVHPGLYYSFLHLFAVWLQNLFQFSKHQSQWWFPVMGYHLLFLFSLVVVVVVAVAMFYYVYGTCVWNKRMMMIECHQLMVCGSTKPRRTADQIPTCSNKLGCIRCPGVLKFHSASSLWYVSLQDTLSR